MCRYTQTAIRMCTYTICTLMYKYTTRIIRAERVSALGTRKRISAKHAQRPPRLVLLETKFEFIAHPFSVIIINRTKIRYASRNGRCRRVLLYVTQETSTIYVYLVHTYTCVRVDNPVMCVSYSSVNPKCFWLGNRNVHYFKKKLNKCYL